jgi:hypothetical protein
MPNHDDAVAVLAAAFNDVDRSLIGDPRRRGSTAVGIETQDLDEAQALARHLASFQVQVRTTIQHDPEGNVASAFVAIYDASDQRRLFEVLQPQLDPGRRQQFEDLVLARGPIPDDILENILRSYRRRRTPHQIANRMNELGIIAGMGQVGWTATKVRNALTEYERRASHSQEAA